MVDVLAVIYCTNKKVLTRDLYFLQTETELKTLKKALVISWTTLFIILTIVSIIVVVNIKVRY